MISEHQHPEEKPMDHELTRLESRLLPIKAFHEDKSLLTAGGKIAAAYSADVKDSIDEILAGDRKPPVLHLSACPRFRVTPVTQDIPLVPVVEAADDFLFVGFSKKENRRVTMRRKLNFCRHCLNRLRKMSRTPEVVDRLAATNDIALFFQVAPALQAMAQEAVSEAPRLTDLSDHPRHAVASPDGFGRIPAHRFNITAIPPFITLGGKPVAVYQPDIGKHFDAMMAGRFAKPALHVAACHVLHKSIASYERLKPVFDGDKRFSVHGRSKLASHSAEVPVELPICKVCLSMLRRASKASPLMDELESRPTASTFFKLLPAIVESVQAGRRRAAPSYGAASPSAHAPEASLSSLKKPTTSVQYTNAAPVFKGEGLAFPGGLIAIEGEGAVLFRDRRPARLDDVTDGLSATGLFHFAQCGSVRNAREKEAYPHVWASTDRETLFDVRGYSVREAREMTVKMPFRPCLNCLKTVNWQGCLTATGDPFETPGFLEAFSASDFFLENHAVFSDRSPLTTKEIAEDFKRRRPGFAKRARAAKIREGRQCRHCGVDLKKHPYLLRGVEKADDTIPLCLSCFRMATGRPPLGAGYRSFRRLDALRREQGVMPDYDWPQAIRAADPALRGVMKLALALGWRVPELNAPLDSNPDVVPDLLWRDRRVAVSLRLDGRMRLGEWTLLSPCGLIEALRIEMRRSASPELLPGAPSDDFA